MAGWSARLEFADERLFATVLSRRTRGLDRVMRAVTVLGDPPVIVVLAVSAVLLLPGAGRGWAGDGLVAMTASHIVVQLLKRIWSRPRPVLPVGVRSMIRAPDRFSFPSGHATAALALALPAVAVLPGGAGAGLLLLALLIGASRCYLGVHYPGDVVAGWGIALVTWAFLPLLSLVP